MKKLKLEVASPLKLTVILRKRKNKKNKRKPYKIIRINVVKTVPLVIRSKKSKKSKKFKKQFKKNRAPVMPYNLFFNNPLKLKLGNSAILRFANLTYSGFTLKTRQVIRKNISNTSSVVTRIQPDPAKLIVVNYLNTIGDYRRQILFTRYYYERLEVQCIRLDILMMRL